MIKNYEDIINMPHHISKKHPQMSISDRAAQFAPFAALTGYQDAIIETGRLVDKKIELTNEEKEVISSKIYYLLENVDKNIEVSICYFIKDEKKNGGKYNDVLGVIKSFNQIDKTIKLTNKMIINLEDIVSINNNIFNVLE
jgi:hypothetical protein